MEISVFIMTVISGLIGTVVMTMVMYLYAAISKKNTKVIAILGRMLTGGTYPRQSDKWKALMAGTCAHFSVGVLFSWSYFLLWSWGIFSVSLEDSLWVGIISGGIAVVVWGTYHFLHASPPKLSLPHYSLALIIAHLVFGTVTVKLFTVIQNL